MLESLYSALGAVLSFFFDVIPNYGIAIILLTIFVRVILLPLTIKQTKSMQKMQKIGPEMKALQAKHKGDKAKLNEEMMKLYKEHQVNPLGGCLPLLMQFPVFIALFRVLNTCGVAVAKGKVCAANQIGTKYLPANSALLAAIHAQNGATTFLGMSMAATPRDILKTGIVPALPYIGLLAAMGLTTWYQTKQASAAQPPGAGASQMAIMGKIMPVMLMFFSFGFPAGVSIYWVVSNIWTIGQQRVLLGKLPKAEEPGPPPKGGGGGGGPRPPKGGGPKGEDAIEARPAKAKASAAEGGRGQKAAAGKGGGGGGAKAGTGNGNPKPADSKPKGGGNGNKPAGGGQARDNGGGAPKGGSSQQRSGQQRPGGQPRKKKRR
ncbi:MAG: YidC/Oxa1 family membrane protein insertase [Actinomycetota bacterium]